MRDTDKRHNTEHLTRRIRQAVNGDPEGLALLFEETYQRLYYYAYLICGSRDAAQDLLQEGYIKCILSLDTLQNPALFYPWMWKILKNLHTNQLRRERLQAGRTGMDTALPEQSDIRQLAVIREENRRLLEAILDDGDTPEEAAEKRELAEILRCIIEELPPEQREAILMYYYEDLSLAEVAQEQNCPVPTVKSRLRYAKQSIRAAILAEEARSGVALHGTLPIPVLPVILERLAGYVTLPPEAALTLFTAAAGMLGIAVTGDTFRLVGTVTTEEHPLRDRTAIVRIRLLPASVLCASLLITLGLGLGMLLVPDPLPTADSVPHTVETAGISDTAQSMDAVPPPENTGLSGISMVYPQIGLENMSSFTVGVGEAFTVQYYPLPADAADQSMVLVSKDEAIVQCRGRQIIGVSPGQTRVYLFPAGDYEEQASVLVTVKAKHNAAPAPTGVLFLTDRMPLLLADQVVSLNYTTLPAYVQPDSLTFVSDNPEVAEADGVNLYTHAPGTTVIRCLRTSDQTELGQIALTVYASYADAPVIEGTSVQISHYVPVLEVGMVRNMVCQVLPYSANPDTWHWENSNPAAVSFDGQILRALAPGIAHLRCIRNSDNICIGDFVIRITEPDDAG